MMDEKTEVIPTHSCLDDITRFFPLSNPESVKQLFAYEIDECKKPNFAVLSLVLGILENTLTSKKTNTERMHSKSWLDYLSRTENHAFIKVHRVHSNVCERRTADNDGKDTFSFPPIQWSEIEELYLKFEEKIKKGFARSYSQGMSVRQVIKLVSDIIWTTLSKNYYKDQPHLQTLYSYSIGNKLDCFGVAFSVVAGCQILGFDNVCLGLSEDHAWVVFTEEGRIESAEVTYHGKVDEHKRGNPIDFSSKKWLYVDGNAVICTPKTMFSAMIYSINTTIDQRHESEELAVIQQNLLWLCYDRGLLNMYPMAVASLGDLEEISPHPNATRTSLQLFEEAIEIAKSKYNNYHVYPFEYLALYYFRHCQWKESLQAAAESANVISKYNCHSDDDEISKYFNEATENFIPHIISEIKERHIDASKEQNGNLNEDAHCFASILKYFDGLCVWEENAPKSAVHEGYAKCFAYCVSGLSEQTRRMVKIYFNAHDGDCKDSENNNAVKLETPADSESGTVSANHANHSAGDTKEEISVTLRSQKMIAVSELLFAKKINSSAIKLQLTAQSSIAVTKKRKRVEV